MSFAILRTNKLTSPGNCGGLSKHLEREMEVLNADKELQKYNRRVVGSGDLWHDVKSRIEQAGIEPRKNGVLAIEFLLTASPEHFQFHKTEKGEFIGKVQNWKNFEKESKQWLEEKFGKQNLVNFTVHFDESTPHIHAVVVPIVEKKEKSKLCAKEYLGGREKLRQMQTDYAKKLEPLGIKRGLEGSKAVHTSIKQFYGLINSIKEASISAIEKGKEIEVDINLPKPSLMDKLNFDKYLQTLENYTTNFIKNAIEKETQRLRNITEQQIAELTNKYNESEVAKAVELLKSKSEFKEANLQNKLKTAQREMKLVVDTLREHGLSVKFKNGQVEFFVVEKQQQEQQQANTKPTQKVVFRQKR